MKSTRVSPKKGVGGKALVPGDKSVSHRSVMLGSIAEGVTEVSGFLAGDDPLATMAAFQAMGVNIERTSETGLVIHGVGLHGLKKPAKTLDIGNSGTSIRLMSGLLSGQHFGVTLDGDASIRKRPMKRVMEPLSKMGARLKDADGAGHAPLAIEGLPAGQKLQAIEYESPVASAQVKSAIILAGLYADGKTTVREPHPSRDHTERMLAHMGVELDHGDWGASIVGGVQPKAATIDVPADISSAAFFLVAALLAGEGTLLLPKVGVNPTRDGIVEALKAMGANIKLENQRNLAGEPVADLRVTQGKLRGTTIGGALIPRLIDEIPAIAVAACFAEGTTTIQDAKELRVKETDRIATMVEELTKIGAKVEPRDDGMVIHGNPALRVPGCTFKSHGDHRVAMSMALTSFRADAESTIEDIACVETSFPGFFELLAEVSS